MMVIKAKSPFILDRRQPAISVTGRLAGTVCELCQDCYLHISVSGFISRLPKSLNVVSRQLIQPSAVCPNDAESSAFPTLWMSAVSGGGCCNRCDAFRGLVSNLPRWDRQRTCRSLHRSGWVRLMHQDNTNHFRDEHESQTKK